MPTLEGRITAIVRQKKDRVRASIFVNEEFAFGVNEQTIEEFRLRKGDFIDGEIERKIKEFDYWIDAKRTALAYLNHRARSEKEIRERLLKDHIPEPTIAKVIDFLKDYRMIDDEAWSKAFINDKLARKKISARQLEFNLLQKGVDKEFIAAAISDLNKEESDEDRAREAAEKRWERLLRTEQDARKRQQKLFSFLAARGFAFELIKKVYASVSGSNAVSDDEEFS